MADCMRRFMFFGSFLLGVLAVHGCGGHDEQAASAVAVPDGGSRPTDGAKGICCRVTADFAHSYTGGYTEDPSTCGELWDNLCNPRIVVGDHGCGTLKYDACQGPQGDPGLVEAGLDAPTD
jgi:hypothetical protein